MTLLLSLIRKDFNRNRVITAVIAIFLILSALLMAGGIRTAVTIVSSIQGLNERAIPPEYLQMHKGTYDEEAFENFLENKDYIKDFLVVKMLNISNRNIIYQGENFEKYLMDNGFVIQNTRFDYLLDMNNEVAVVNKGEIGVPVYYAEELGIQAGDVISLQNGDYRKELTVATIIRDAQMNAALASSKRFLISQADLNELSQYMGEWEYSFQFMFKEGASQAVFQQDYANASLPSNGVAITGNLITLLNAFSHGLVAFIIIAISMLLIIIAILCLSYIIQATMAEENYTLGEMKAIGLPGKEISKLYQNKYTILVLFASIIGYLAAIPFGNFLSSSVIMYYGMGTSNWMKGVLPLIGVTLLSIFVILMCRRIIGKKLKSTVIELMRGEETIKKEGHYSLRSTGYLHHNLVIGCGELKCKWKDYVLIFIVFVLSSFLILLPMNMKSTINDPTFMTYMGVGESDIRIDIQYIENLEEQKDVLESYLRDDAQIGKYAIYRYGNVQTQNKEGDWESIRVESGDQSVFPLEYLEGIAPKESKEMALSYLNARELGKAVGDSLAVIYHGEELLFTISGIYQDITYGGRTAKAPIDFDEKDVEVYIIYLNLVDGIDIPEKVADLREILTEGKITPINEFITQTLGGVTNNLGVLEVAAVAISLVLIMLITSMILQLIIAKERSEIANKKAIGFSSIDIRIQLGIRIISIQIVAIIIGTILANVLGEVIFGWILSAMGASKIEMLISPFHAYLLFPTLQVLIVCITVIVGTKAVRNYHIRDQILG